MRKTITLAAFILAMVLPASATHVTRRGPTSHLFVKKKLKPGFKPASGISTERATEIQTALAKAGYLNGEPTGVMDAQTTSALQKMQADNGWQTKITPDARALIRLGLGPQSESASASLPDTISAVSDSQASN
jgi:peptidoglycan hydrolase-like protein with peptidoglycan-binding domain